MLTKKSRCFSGLLFLALAVTVSCNLSDDQSGLFSEPERYKLGEFTADGVTVAAYSEAPLDMGFHHIYFEVHEDGALLDRPEITFTTMMHMENHSHASPHQNPSAERDPDAGLFRGWAIFTMPSGMMGSWELIVSVRDPDADGREVEGMIDIEIEESARVRTFMADSGQRYVLTLVQPKNPRTGLNDLVVTLHQRESMMHFPPVKTALFDFEPWMPSMDHGSSNNVDPVHDSDGFYHGKVNFSMTGDWELRFDIHREDEHLGEFVFALDF